MRLRMGKYEGHRRNYFDWVDVVLQLYRVEDANATVLDYDTTSYAGISSPPKLRTMTIDPKNSPTPVSKLRFPARLSAAHTSVLMNRANAPSLASCEGPEWVRYAGCRPREDMIDWFFD